MSGPRPAPSALVAAPRHHAVAIARSCARRRRARPPLPLRASRALATLLALLAAPGAAATTTRAETVTVIAPEGQGPGADALAAELGVGVDLALAAHPSPMRLNHVPLLPGEAVAVFGCLRLDAACALRAGRAAGADLVLLGHVGHDGVAVTVGLSLLDVRLGAPRRTLERVLRAHPAGAPVASPLRAALRALPTALLADAPADSAALVVSAAPGDDLRLDGRPLAADRLTAAPPGARRLVVRSLDGTIRRTTLPVAAGEVRLVDAGHLPSVTSAAHGPRQIGAWMALGVGAASLLGAGYMAIQVEREQSDYNRARSAAALAEHRERGDKYALAGNVLLATGAAAVGVSLWLFLDD